MIALFEAMKEEVDVFSLYNKGEYVEIYGFVM